MPQKLLHSSKVAAIGDHYCSRRMPTKDMHTAMLLNASLAFVRYEHAINITPAPSSPVIGIEERAFAINFERRPDR
jgi:hypothetical protein